MGYKYTMRPLAQGLQSSYSIVYIFSKHLSLEYYCIFLSLTKYLFKHQRVLTFFKGDLLQVLASSRFGLISTKYMLKNTLAKDNG
jgi:hypothetical protein